MSEAGTWLCLQPFLDDEDAVPVPPTSRPKFLHIVEGTETAYQLAIEHNVNLAWGTDTLFSADLAKKQGKQLTKMTLWFSPSEVLMATSTNAEPLQLSGLRNPYPGTLGRVESGAIADLLLVDGDPLANIDLIADPDTNPKLILKNGAVVRNTL